MLLTCWDLSQHVNMLTLQLLKKIITVLVICEEKNKTNENVSKAFQLALLMSIGSGDKVILVHRSHVGI